MAVLGWLLGCLTLLTLANGIPSENYREERRFLNSVGRGDCIAKFEMEEIELNHIPRLDNATLRELGVNTIGARLRLRDAAQDFLQGSGLHGDEGPALQGDQDRGGQGDQDAGLEGDLLQGAELQGAELQGDQGPVLQEDQDPGLQ